MQVIRIRRPETIAAFKIRDLIMRAVHETRYPGTTGQAFYDEMVAGIASSTLGVFVGFSLTPSWDSPAEPEAICVASLPWSALMMWPQINLAYSRSRKLSVALGARVREWVKLHEYDRIIGCNLWHNDEAFCRVFSHVGKTSVIGSLVEARI